MSLRTVKKALEDIFQDLLITLDPNLRIIKGHDNFELELIDKPRIFIICRKISNHEELGDETVYRASIDYVLQFDVTKESEINIGSTLNNIEIIMSSLEDIQVKAKSLFPANNPAFSEFHIQFIENEEFEIEHSSLDADEMLSFSLIIQRLTAS